MVDQLDHAVEIHYNELLDIQPERFIDRVHGKACALQPVGGVDAVPIMPLNGYQHIAQNRDHLDLFRLFIDGQDNHDIAVPALLAHVAGIGSQHQNVPDVGITLCLAVDRHVAEHIHLIGTVMEAIERLLVAGTADDSALRVKHVVSGRNHILPVLDVIGRVPHHIAGRLDIVVVSVQSDQSRADLLPVFIVEQLAVLLDNAVFDRFRLRVRLRRTGRGRFCGLTGRIFRSCCRFFRLAGWFFRLTCRVLRLSCRVLRLAGWFLRFACRFFPLCRRIGRFPGGRFVRREGVLLVRVKIRGELDIHNRLLRFRAAVAFRTFYRGTVDESLIPVVELLHFQTDICADERCRQQKQCRQHDQDRGHHAPYFGTFFAAGAVFCISFPHFLHHPPARDSFPGAYPHSAHRHLLSDLLYHILPACAMGFRKSLQVCRCGAGV